MKPSNVRYDCEQLRREKADGSLNSTTHFQALFIDFEEVVAVDFQIQELEYILPPFVSIAMLQDSLQLFNISAC
jgi:hypothetical protein